MFTWFFQILSNTKIKIPENIPCNLGHKNADAIPNFLRPQSETDMVGVKKAKEINIDTYQM